ncbi:hypothetical protein MC04F16_24080 [Escherichia coli]
MFNLIMRSVDWDVGREMMEVSRVFEFTDDHISMQFKNNNSPDLDKLISLPCLFMQEGVGDELGNDSNLLIVFYVQIMPDDFVMQLHRF